MGNLLDRYREAHDLFGHRVRVPSLVVTIFGDAIVPRGGVVRLGVIQQVTERLGIGNNALRTAMSRLASDGWLNRQRIGRVSYYQPTKRALQETMQASKVIYFPDHDDWNGRLLLAIAANSDGFSAERREFLHRSNFAFRSRHLAVAPRFNDQDALDEMSGLCLFFAEQASVGGVENLVSNVSFQNDCTKLYADFTKAAAGLMSTDSDLKSLDGLDCFALRTLLVHNWRRIVLKDVYWPGALRAKSWPGHKARLMIAQLYHQLLPRSENWLSGLNARPEGELPAAQTDQIKRFSSKCYN